MFQNFFYVPVLIVLLYSNFAILADSTSSNQLKIAYEKKPNRNTSVKYSFPSTAPKEWREYTKLDEPKIEDLRLKLTQVTAGAFTGPDGGQGYYWKPGRYKWARSDGSLFQEWENGNWQLQIPNLLTFDVMHPTCNGCLPNYRYLWEDGTEIHKVWIQHRHDYSIYYQNEKSSPALNWLIPNQDKSPPNRLSIGPYEFYYSDNWNFYLHGLRDSFNANAFFHELEREYGMSNKGKIPVIMFDKASEFSAYNGRNLPAVSSESGIGSKDSILMCCGEKLKQSTGNAVLDLDTQIRTYFGTFYHEATHNMHHIACISKRAGKTGSLAEQIADPWFAEGFANHVASTFTPQKRAEFYDQLAKRISENKIPKDFDALVKEEYHDLLPYSLGAYLVEYMHREHGKEAIKQFIHLSCMGEATKSVIKQVTGKEASKFYLDAIADFKEVYPKSSKQIKLWRFGHLTKINPLHVKEFESFQKNRIKLPSNVREIKEWKEIPDLKFIFEADVSSYAGEVEGDFFSHNGERFYLWNDGNYKWYDDDYELFFNTGNFILLKYKGWQVINWPDGKSKMIAPDGSSVFFSDAKQKPFYSKEGEAP